MFIIYPSLIERPIERPTTPRNASISYARIEIEEFINGLVGIT